MTTCIKIFNQIINHHKWLAIGLKLQQSFSFVFSPKLLCYALDSLPSLPEEDGKSYVYTSASTVGGGVTSSQCLSERDKSIY